MTNSIKRRNYLGIILPKDVLYAENYQTLLNEIKKT